MALQNLSILDKASAEQFYQDVLNKIKDPNKFYTEKILSLNTILEKVYKEITKNKLPDKMHLSEIITYVKENYTVKGYLIYNSVKLNNIGNDKRHNAIEPKPSSYPESIRTVIDCINFYSSIDIPQELEDVYQMIFSNGITPDNKFGNNEISKEDINGIERRMNDVLVMLNKARGTIACTFDNVIIKVIVHINKIELFVDDKLLSRWSAVTWYLPFKKKLIIQADFPFLSGTKTIEVYIKTSFFTKVMVCLNGVYFGGDKI
jgi:hypothetical protein